MVCLTLAMIEKEVKQEKSGIITMSSADRASLRRVLRLASVKRVDVDDTDGGRSKAERKKS